MLYTTIPSILLSLVLYLIIGLCYDSKPVDISQYLTGLSHGFNISLLTMLVPAFTGWLIYRKTPSLITLLLSASSRREGSSHHHCAHYSVERDISLLYDDIICVNCSDPSME